VTTSFGPTVQDYVLPTIGQDRRRPGRTSRARRRRDPLEETGTRAKPARRQQQSLFGDGGAVPGSCRPVERSSGLSTKSSVQNFAGWKPFSSAREICTLLSASDPLLLLTFPL